MVHQISVSDETMDRLKACAEPFRDREPEDVIRRLLDEHYASVGNGDAVQSPRVRENAISGPVPKQSTSSRVPRERGATVEIEGREIRAATVADLYGQVLRLLVDKHRAQLDRIVPFSTSAQRYLIASVPVHPRGNDFVIPVKYRGYNMEAHKDYKNAIEHLQKLASKLGLAFKYIG